MKEFEISGVEILRARATVGVRIVGSGRRTVTAKHNLLPRWLTVTPASRREFAFNSNQRFSGPLPNAS